ncbi:membrane protein insertase YidC [Georgenia thermotolerans]|uniref:Membrane protein insertase YidC n=1 Tax=Georgenia thermotolerans TaxID=527326 RepID=A0A7J5UMF1_9MICO|nr:membrane protein insertase YidC [Georgenia thermotolerans]KAE8763558.1 membrane protein insertase YidC [Georgenia thermotolerans]
MGFFDTILSPIMVAVAWIMVRVHDLLVFLGMSAGSGWAWVLSIVGLTVVIRILIIPLFFKQIKASRSMQLVQPEMQKLQKKYKNKTDPASRQKMQEEMMALYREHGANPFSSCLPILLQMPIFFALFRVLNSLGPLANGTYPNGPSIGPLDQQLAAQAESSTLFGAPISETFLSSSDATVKVVTVFLIVLMSATTFLTQRQLTMKNMPASALDNPMARQQRMLMYVLPLIFAFSGVNFPIGVLIYWSVSNLWSMGQQFYTIRRQPAPGSEAAKLRAERLAKKRERKGLPPLEEEEKAAEEQPRGGQRVQPKRKDRAKRTGAAQVPGAVPSTVSADEVEEAPDEDAGDGEVRGKDGLTAAERAQKRYEERAAQRRAAAAKRKPQGKKKK